MIIPGFQAVPGHSRQTSWLKSIAEKGDWSGAYLFCGPRDTGLFTLARSIAMAGNCEKGNGNTCGICSSCKMIITGVHPEVTVLTPEKNNISIDSIRKIRKDINLQPAYGRRRFIIIDSAPSMNVSAQNALLKTLEEPPDHASFILITSSAAGLLPTIKSRCTTVNFGLPSLQEVISWLSNYHTNPDFIEDFAELALDIRGLLQLDPGLWAKPEALSSDAAPVELLDLSSMIAENLSEELESAHSAQSLQQAIYSAFYSVALYRNQALEHLWGNIALSPKLNWLGAASIVNVHISNAAEESKKLVKLWAKDNNIKDEDSVAAGSTASFLETRLITTGSEAIFRKVARLAAEDNSNESIHSKSDIYKRLSTQWSPETALEAAESLASAREHVYRSVNLSLAMDTAFLDIERIRNERQ